MINLSKDAQLLSLGWLVIGVFVYFLYGMRNAKLGKEKSE
jgi:APA family basic amino acid/polyamine antiporter